MTDLEPSPVRRPPPPFRRVTVERVTDLSPHLRRIVFAGTDLDGFPPPAPAASVRLLVTRSGDLVIPEWNGNEFLLPDGSRPLLRTFTPRHLRADPPEMELDIVIHGDDGVSGWAGEARPGDPAAISGPGRGYTFDTDAGHLILLGDEAAIPAISQLLETAPTGMSLAVHVEVTHDDARIDLPAHPGGAVAWHDLPEGRPRGTTLLDALAASPIDGARVWAAGEAAAMQRIRRHLAVRGIDRAHTTVRGYWKQGSAGDE